MKPPYDADMASVLVVDDEPMVRDVVVQYLRRHGFTTLEAGDGAQARELLAAGGIDLAVLDIMLPVTSGLDLCRWIRSRPDGADLPVILLTARGEETDRIVGLELGADDYVTKPFSPRELVARVRTVLRRSDRTVTAANGSILAIGQITIDAAAREVQRDGVPVRLTAREFDLLAFLARHPRAVFSRDQLLERVWGYDTGGAGLGTDTVTVHVRRLREKLEDDPSQPALLQTVWGVGYRLVP